MNFKEFYMNEDVRSDERMRNHAQSIFDLIYKKLVDEVDLHEQSNGTFIMAGKSLGFGVSDLFFLFVPDDNSIYTNLDNHIDKEKSKIQGGFGRTKNNLNVVVIPILKDFGDKSNIAYNFKLYESTFIHEFAHYKLHIKHQGNAKHNINSIDDYYNNHDELMAYYQEAIHKFERSLKKFTNHYRKIMHSNNERAEDIIKLIKSYIPDSTESFIQFLFKHFFDTYFIDSLNEDSMKRLRKRLGQYHLSLKDMGDNIVFKI